MSSLSLSLLITGTFFPYRYLPTVYFSSPESSWLSVQAVLLNRLPSVYSAHEKSLKTKCKVTAGKQTAAGEEEEKRAQI